MTAPVSYTFVDSSLQSKTGYTMPLGVQASAYALTVTFASDIAPLQAAGVYNSSTLTLSNGQIVPLQLDAAGNLKVNVVVGGGGGAITAADGAIVTIGSEADAAYSGSGSGTAISLLKWIGAKLTAIAASVSGTLTVGLPAGAATAANQPALNGDGGALAHVTNFPATQPISVAALPLPVGAATAANQIINPVGAANIAVAPASINSNSAAVQIVAARTGAPGTGRVSVTLYNAGPEPVYFGPSGVTASTGLLLPVGVTTPPLPTTAAIYAILPVAVITASTVNAVEIY